MLFSNWLTHYGRLFICLGSDSPHCVPACGVYSVSIQTDKIKCWTCGYCGSTNLDALNCNHCNAPRKSRKRKGELHIQGYMPIAQILDELADNFRLEITNGKCNDPRVHRKEDVVMVAENCKVENKWIDCMVGMGPDDNAVIVLNLNVECDISLRFND